MIATTDPLTAARSAALFVSSLCATDDPTRAQIEAAIQQSLLTHGGSRGCAADVAAAYGDYPELAAPRMRWARGVVLRLDGQMVLHLPVNLSDAVEGLAAPCAASLGGRVYSTGRPVWISDYRTADKITPRFRSAAEAEGLRAVIGVPIVHEGKVLGVLYGG